MKIKVELIEQMKSHILIKIILIEMEMDITFVKFVLEQ
jgi:hypothetical protein